MQVTDTVHYIVVVKRKADEMDVKDKEMTIELEDVSEEESKEQTEECSDKKQRHKRKGGCFKTVMLAFAMVIDYVLGKYSFSAAYFAVVDILHNQKEKKRMFHCWFADMFCIECFYSSQRCSINK